MTLIFDEIYVAHRIEYSRANKSVVGLTEECQAARTILVFMISSVSDEYRDVITMIPINRMSAEILTQHFWQIVKQISHCLLYTSPSPRD